MTTGTRTVDLRKWHPATLWGTYLTGPYSTKTWSGADSPKGKNTNYFWFQRPNGKLVKKKLWATPPKRARQKTDHPYTASWEKWVNPEIQIWQPGWTRTQSAGFKELFPPGNFPSRWSSNDDLVLFGRLRDAIGGSSFNAAVAFAEGNQSLKMIADSARRIYSAWGAAKKKQFKQAAHILTGGKQQKTQKMGRKVATNWLELQYGWLPLLSDVKDAAEFLAQQLNFPLQETVRVKYSRKLGRPLGLDPTIQPTVVYGVVRKQIIARISEVNVPQLLGLTDPLSVAWEKLPYSFVLDWFIPIGSWLSARGLRQAVTGKFIVSRKEFFGWQGAKSLNPNFAFTGADSWRYENGVFVREVTSKLSVPTPDFKPLAKAASWRHAANAVALIIGRTTTGSGHLRI